MVLNFSKTVSFLYFFPFVSNKSKAVIVVYVYGFASSHFTLSENDIVYYAMKHSLEDIGV